MVHILNISETIGSDVRSRSVVNILRQIVRSSESSSIVLDFNGVSFISRSFSDELCVFISQFPEIEICNMTSGVKNMFEVVRDARTKTRVRAVENSEIKDFDNIKALSAYMRNKM